MTTNLRSEKLLASILPTVGLAWATRAPKLPIVVEPAPIVVEPTPDGWVIEAADALALAWESHR
jgi:hypothetical protein